MKHHKVEQHTLQWLQLRLGIPTASDFDRILTPKKRERSTQSEHYMDKLLYEWMAGEVSEDEMRAPTEWMQRGIDKEDSGFAGYEFQTGVETQPGGFFTLDNGLAGASPDRLVGSDGLLELKCPLGPQQMAAWRRGIGADHICQLQGQLWISEREWVDLYSYHPRMVLTPKRIYRDEDFIQILAMAIEDFIEEMLRVRADLEREHGPFLRQGTEPPETIHDSSLITEADLDEILRLRRK